MHIARNVCDCVSSNRVRSAPCVTRLSTKIFSDCAHCFMPTCNCDLAFGIIAPVYLQVEEQTHGRKTSVVFVVSIGMRGGARLGDVCMIVFSNLPPATSISACGI